MRRSRRFGQRSSHEMGCSVGFVCCGRNGQKLVGVVINVVMVGCNKKKRLTSGRRPGLVTGGQHVGKEASKATDTWTRDIRPRERQGTGVLTRATIVSPIRPHPPPPNNPPLLSFTTPSYSHCLSIIIFIKLKF